MELNKDKTITILGLNFDLPNNPAPWDLKETKDGKTITRELWLDTYVQEGAGGFRRDAYRVSVTNRGRVEFEGRAVGKEDAEKIRYLFSLLGG